MSMDKQMKIFFHLYKIIKCTDFEWRGDKILFRPVQGAKWQVGEGMAAFKKEKAHKTHPVVPFHNLRQCSFYYVAKSEFLLFQFNTTSLSHFDNTNMQQNEIRCKFSVLFFITFFHNYFCLY
jgi:hypothetical protein